MRALFEEVKRQITTTTDMANKSASKEDIEVTKISFNEMDAETTEQALNLIKDVVAKSRKGDLRSFSEMASSLKADLDSQMGPTVWHVIVGEQFGSFVSHETSKIIYVFFQRVGVLCWAHG